MNVINTKTDKEVERERKKKKERRRRENNMCREEAGRRAVKRGKKKKMFCHLGKNREGTSTKRGKEHRAAGKSPAERLHS